MKRFFRWLWRDEHRLLIGFVTLCMVIELLPVRALAEGLEELAEAVAAEEVVPAPADAETPEPEVAAPAPAPAEEPPTEVAEPAPAPAEQPAVTPAEEPAVAEAEEPAAAKAEKPTAETEASAATPEGEPATETEKPAPAPVAEPQVEAEESATPVAAESAAQAASTDEAAAGGKVQDEKAKVPAVKGSAAGAAASSATKPAPRNDADKHAEANRKVTHQGAGRHAGGSELVVIPPADVVFKNREQKLEPESVTSAEDGRELVKDRDYVLSWSADCTNAGTVSITVKGMRDYSGSSATVFYDIKKLPTTLHYKGITGTVTYDGRTHEAEGRTFSLTFDEDGEHTPFTHNAAYSYGGSAEASGIDAGTYMMGLSKNDIQLTDFAKRNLDFKIDFSDGYMKINKAPLTIKAKPQTYVYNGREQGPAGTYTEGLDSHVTVEGLKGGDTLASITLTGKKKPVGSYDGEIVPSDAAVTFNHETQKTITDNYNVTYTDAALTIEANPLSVEAQSDSKDYDGSPLVGGATSAPKGATITYSVLGDDGETWGAWSEQKPSITDVGTLTYKARAELASYTTVESEPASLQVGPCYVTVTIEGKIDSKAYNGEEQTVTGYKVTNISSELYTKDDFTFSGDAVAKGTDVKANGYPMGLSEKRFKNTNDNFEVTFQVIDGRLDITPVTDQVIVTIKGHQAKKTYNASLQKVEGYDVTDISNPLYKESYIKFLEEGQGADVASCVDVTTIYMNLKSSMFENTSGNFANVMFDVEDGYLTIEPAPLTITANDHTFIYDGELKGEGDAAYEDAEEIASMVTVEGLQGADKLAELVVTGITRTDAGVEEDAYEVTGVRIDDSANNKNNEDYAITFKTGKLIITPRTVRLVSANLSKPYDGSALVNGKTPLATEKGFVKGDGATYTFTGSQTEVGSSPNAFTYELNEGTKASNYDIKKAEGTLTVTDADADGEVAITKAERSKPSNGKTYALGEEATWTITVENGFGEPKTITTTDGLTGDSWTDEIAAGDTKTYITSAYAITEQDILAGSVANEAVATVKDGPSWTAQSKVATSPKDNTIEVTKKSDKDGAPVAFGEEITYTVTVENKGNVTIGDVKVTDGLTGDEWTIDTLAPGDAKSFEATHTVTEADIIAGKVVNSATAKGTDPEGDSTEDEATTEDATEPKRAHLSVTKEATSKAPDGGYALGDVITYKITVTNDGNVTIGDVKVDDALTGDTWTIDALAPGDEKSFETSYTVTQADIDAGSVKNVATVTSSDPDAGEVTVVPGTAIVEVGKTFTITYDLNGGSFGGITGSIREKHRPNEVITIHEAPTREGYTFDYWKGSAYQPGDQYTVTGDHTFVAQWKKNAEPAEPAKPVRRLLPKTGDPALPAAVLGLMGILGNSMVALGLRRRRHDGEDRRKV